MIVAAVSLKELVFFKGETTLIIIVKCKKLLV